jgi:hypothetical protein
MVPASWSCTRALPPGPSWAQRFSVGEQVDPEVVEEGEQADCKGELESDADVVEFAASQFLDSAEPIFDGARVNVAPSGDRRVVATRMEVSLQRRE